MTSQFTKKKLRTSLAVIAGALALALTACAGGSPATPDKTAADSGLMTEGKLVVGMNLQYKPQMFLDDAGKPSGYDVELLNLLAKDMGVKLDIQNLDFNGLIPGLQAKQFDMVSVGLGATDERKKVIDFSLGYVPYATILGGAPGSKLEATIDAYNQPGVIITALQGSTSEQLVKDSFPKATVTAFPDQNAALLEVASGRADAVVVEDYILAEFARSNADQVEPLALDEPLSLYYGSWAVQKGNSALDDKLETFLCKIKADGTLEKLYTKWMAPTMPEMPGC